MQNFGLPVISYLYDTVIIIIITFFFLAFDENLN